MTRVRAAPLEPRVAKMCPYDLEGHVDYILRDNIPVGRAGPAAGMHRGPGTYIFFRGSPHK